MMSFCEWVQQDWVKPFVGIFTALHFAYMACGLIFFIKGIFLWYYLDAEYGADYLQEVKLHSSNTSLYSTLAVLVQIYLALTSIYVIGCTLMCIMFKRITIFLLLVAIVMFLSVQIYALTLHVRIFCPAYRDYLAEVCDTSLKGVHDNAKEGDIKHEMKRVMARSYHGDNGTDRMTMSINTLFMRLNCCAIDDFRDLHTAPWNRQYEINTTNVEFKAPYFCCLINCTSSHTYCNTKRTPRIDQFTRIGQVECAVRPNETNSNYMKGCYNILQDGLNVLNTCNIVFIVIEILTVILATHFYRKTLQHDNDDSAAINTTYDSVKQDLPPDNKLFRQPEDDSSELKT